MWKHLVGLIPTAPQFAKVAIAPKVHPLYGSKATKATYVSESGPIATSWKIAADGSTVALNASLPVGVVQGTIVVPTPFTIVQTPPTSMCTSASEHAQSLHLACGGGSVIESIDFAAFGTPTPPPAGGACSEWKVNATCNANQNVVKAVVSKLCIGHSGCEIDFGSNGKNSFGPDPCFDVTKTLAVAATCSGGRDVSQSATAVVTERGQIIWDGTKLVGASHPGVINASAVANGVAFEVYNGAFAFESSAVKK